MFLWKLEQKGSLDGGKRNRIMIYLIADTHFGHHNIIKYEDRPFDNIYQMDKQLIEKWNSVITDDDKVFHLGDFSLCSTRKSFYIFNRLKGKKYLIKGNHDVYSDTKLTERMGFKKVFEEFWLGDNILLTHKPKEVHPKVLNIHGHTHKLFYLRSKWRTSKHHFCVSAELIDYTPISLEDLIDEWKGQSNLGVIK